MIHIFHSGSVSGPERLVIPALQKIPNAQAIFLVEERLGEKGLEAFRYAESLGLKCHQVLVKSRFDPRAIKNLRSLLDELNPEIIHAHDVKATFYAVLGQWGRKNRTVLCSTHHGVKGRPDLISKAYELFYRYLLLPYCNRVFAVSKADYKVLERVPAVSKKLSLHLNGIRPPRQISTEERSELRNSWELQSETIGIGWIGRLSKEKNPLFLIELAKSLNNRPELSEAAWKICIFGDGPLLTELKEQIVQSDLSDRITLHGYRGDISSELGALDIVINTSSNEGLPISLLESGYAAVPVCAHATGGIPELIPTGEFGALVSAIGSAESFAEKLSPLIVQRSSRETAGKALKKRVKALFSEEKWVSQLIKEYAQLALLRSESAVTWGSDIRLFPSEWRLNGRSER